MTFACHRHSMARTIGGLVGLGTRRLVPRRPVNRWPWTLKSQCATEYTQHASIAVNFKLIYKRIVTQVHAATMTFHKLKAVRGVFGCCRRVERGERCFKPPRMLCLVFEVRVGGCRGSCCEMHPGHFGGDLATTKNEFATTKTTQ